MDPAKLIHQPERFDCTTPQHKLGSGNFWAISDRIDRAVTPAETANLRMASLWQDGLTVFALYDDGWIYRVTADARGLTPYLQLGAIGEFPLPPADSKLVRVMWHVENAAGLRGVVLGAHLVSDAESARANLLMTALYGAFGGLGLGLLCYNLALWGALRHRFQLWYCAMVAALLAYAFSSSGTLAWVFPEIANNDRLKFNYLTLALSGATALMFARTFFEERIYVGWLGRLATGVAILLGGTGVFVFLMAGMAVRVADTILTSVFVALTLIVVPTLWRAWRLRSNFLWLFAIAWGAPILAVVIRTLGNLHIVPWSFWIDNSTMLSMSAEALLSSLAIAYRIRLLSIERDEAITAKEIARRLADTDPLTGLLNRRAFLERAIARGGDQVLHVADLDHFKRVNDTLGHDGGDEVLRVFARMLRASSPTTALIARIGGEEFAILTSRAEPVEPERILAKLRATRMPFDVQVTASIGTCEGPLTSEVQWKALYRGADKALFQAKSAGRDRARAAPAREAA
jgi:diguanylate cyclase (GGDEF)-like protein